MVAQKASGGINTCCTDMLNVVRIDVFFHHEKL